MLPPLRSVYRGSLRLALVSPRKRTQRREGGGEGAGDPAQGRSPQAASAPAPSLSPEAPAPRASAGDWTQSTFPSQLADLEGRQLLPRKCP